MRVCERVAFGAGSQVMGAVMRCFESQTCCNYNLHTKTGTTLLSLSSVPYDLTVKKKEKQREEKKRPLQRRKKPTTLGSK